MSDFLQGKTPGQSKEEEYIKSDATDKCLVNFYESSGILSKATKESRLQFEAMLSSIAKELEDTRRAILDSTSVGEMNVALIECPVMVQKSLMKLSEVKIEAEQEK